MLKYEAALYEAVCVLVDRLAQLPADEEIEVEIDDGEGVFVIAKRGVELARLPKTASTNPDW